ncbi:MAG: OmpA family protein [Proteobacteria bacterium]|nr:OmpA family protein [Pseudomonadota bacterium]
MPDQTKPPPGKPKRTALKAILFAIASLGAAGAIGHYAWNLRGEHMAVLEKLEASEQCQGQLAETQTRNRELEQKVASCQAEQEAVKGKHQDASASLAQVEANLNATRAELEAIRKQREETAKRLAAFKKLTEQFQKMIDAGKLDVVIRDGRMLLKLPASVLFDSGSAVLSRAGELALMEVAIILRELPERKFMIAGHTDNRPIENAGEESRYKNNWELSAARAITVTQFLIEAKLKPINLVAAGFGEHDPIGDNKTATGRQENRRIEIELLPNLSELPALPDDAGASPTATSAR